MNIFVNGKAIEVSEGETVGSVLLKRRQQALRNTRIEGKPRGMFCGIGICFDCIVTIDEVINQRACVTQLREGMRIEVGE